MLDWKEHQVLDQTRKQGANLSNQGRKAFIIPEHIITFQVKTKNALCSLCQDMKQFHQVHSTPMEAGGSRLVTDPVLVVAMMVLMLTQTLRWVVEEMGAITQGQATILRTVPKEKDSNDMTVLVVRTELKTETPCTDNLTPTTQCRKTSRMQQLHQATTQFHRTSRTQQVYQATTHCRQTSRRRQACKETV